MTDREYDPATCITAGELRARGLDVPTNIPDVGWVPRDAVKFDTKVKLDGETLHATTTVTFDESFRWIDVKVKIEERGVPSR